MIPTPEAKVQEICCDGTSVNLPDKPFLTFKSTFHSALHKGRVHVDFSLHIMNKPAQPLGIWRCRINFWLPENVISLSYDQGFEYYKTGFRRAMAEAEKFVDIKYGFKSIGTPLSDEQLLERYKKGLEAAKG